MSESDPLPFEFVAIYNDYWPFSAGEVILVDGPYGREVMGEGRKPSKWDVECDYFSTAAEAVEAVRTKGLEARLPHDLDYTNWRATIPPLLTLLDALGL